MTSSRRAAGARGRRSAAAGRGRRTARRCRPGPRGRGGVAQAGVARPRRPGSGPGPARRARVGRAARHRSTSASSTRRRGAVELGERQRGEVERRRRGGAVPCPRTAAAGSAPGHPSEAWLRRPGGGWEHPCRGGPGVLRRRRRRGASPRTARRVRIASSRSGAASRTRCSPQPRRRAEAPRCPTLDRTDLPLVTIDPATARDLDQALHLERDRGTGTSCTTRSPTSRPSCVAGGPLDAEAHRRGETFYGVGRHGPAAPSGALRGRRAPCCPTGRGRPCSGRSSSTPPARGSSLRVERALVRSRVQLSYEEVQADIDADGADPDAGSPPRGRRAPRLARERARGGRQSAAARPGGRVSRTDRWRWSYRRSAARGGMERADLAADRDGGGPPHGRGPSSASCARSLLPTPTTYSSCTGRQGPRGALAARGAAYPDLIRSLDPSRAADAAMLTASTSLLRGAGYVGVRRRASRTARALGAGLDVLRT